MSECEARSTVVSWTESSHKLGYVKWRVNWSAVAKKPDEEEKVLRVKRSQGDLLRKLTGHRLKRSLSISNFYLTHRENEKRRRKTR